MYFLTAMHVSSEAGFEGVQNDDRCFGYYSDKQDAMQAADVNAADMHECLYNFLLIEKIPEGIHARAEEEVWYAWDDGLSGWVHTEKPAWSNNIINWSIG